MMHKRQRAWLGALFCLMVLWLLSVSGVLAQEPPAYQLELSTVKGGGGLLEGGDPDSDYTLLGTVGQDTVDAPLSGGDYTLDGGLWPLPVNPQPGDDPYRLFLPLVIK